LYISQNKIIHPLNLSSLQMVFRVHTDIFIREAEVNNDDQKLERMGNIFLETCC